MKNIIITIVVLFTLNSNAQTKSIFDDAYGETGVYYKDLNNDLDTFVGTYTYTSGTKIFKIELRKKIRSNINNIYYEDMLIGAYEYKDNGITIANTFNDLYNNNSLDGSNFDLYARIAFLGDWQGCEACSTDPNNVWIMGSITSMTNKSVNKIRFKRITVAGQPALRVLILAGGAVAKRADEPPTVIQPASFPCCTEFTMLKQ
uniref:DUF6705 family protein n=1 Tax=Flavobacterium sp. TaxID=239 RepID=UPI00404B925B